MPDDPLYDALLQEMRETVRAHGGAADLLPEGEFDCCMKAALDSIWPKIVFTMESMADWAKEQHDLLVSVAKGRATPEDVQGYLKGPYGRV